MPPKQCLFVMVITIDVVCVRKEKEGVTSPGMGGEVEEGGENGERDERGEWQR